MKLIQPVLINLAGRTLHSDNGGTFSYDIGSTGHLSKVTRSKLNKLIQAVFLQLVYRTLTQIMVVLDVFLKSLVVS